MRAIGVIPARWGSTRFEGKVLADVNGKPMVQHVWERARQCRQLEDVLIACDDERVYEAVRTFGAKAVMTYPSHPSGSDRIAEAVRPLNVRIVVNVQGDEPLIRPDLIDELVVAIADDPSCPMATAVKRIKDEKELADSNVVKVIVDQKKRAVYFSRACVPFNRDGQPFANLRYYKHIGLYAYTKDFLNTFVSLPPSALERTEKLEQLRVIESGYAIKVVETDFESVGVDTPEDLKKVISLMGKG